MFLYFFVIDKFIFIYNKFPLASRHPKTVPSIPRRKSLVGFFYFYIICQGKTNGEDIVRSIFLTRGKSLQFYKSSSLSLSFLSGLCAFEHVPLFLVHNRTTHVHARIDLWINHIAFHLSVSTDFARDKKHIRHIPFYSIWLLLYS